MYNRGAEAWFINSNSDTLNQEGSRLYDKFVAEYGPVQSWDIVFATTFEALRVLHLAVEEGKTLAEVREGGSFRGLFGEYRFNASGEIVGLKFGLTQVIQGKSVAFADQRIELVG